LLRLLFFNGERMCKSVYITVQEVRKLFTDPEVKQVSEISNVTWKPADLEGLVKYLVHEKQFSEERVRSAVDKMNAAKGKASQNRMESFFNVRSACNVYHSLGKTGKVVCLVLHIA
jgi:hypothetical protein